MDQPPSPEPVASKPRQKENIKETIESILIAFILAFVFRAFVVEAFVIPSGSMATTLMGAHMRFRCEDCGYEFTANYPSARPDDSTAVESATLPRFAIHCPNCGFKVQRESEVSLRGAKPIPVYYGDRILVLKYVYLLQDPSRWDVVVFKTPTRHMRPDLDFTQNFIKRLVGKPGETIMLLDGDVFVRPNSTDSNGDSDELWTVQHKPHAVQEAMWRVVYDNDYFPHNLPMRRDKWTFPWRSVMGSGWGTPGRVLHFSNPDGSGSLSFDANANSGTYPFTDWLPYNETMVVRDGRNDYYNHDGYARELIHRWNVSDLKLQFYYERHSGGGPLSATLTKLGHAFSAEIGPESAKVVHRRPDGSSGVIGQVALKPGGGPMHVEFQNVDYQVSLRLDGKLVVQSTPQQYSPDVSDLLARHQKRNQLNSMTGEYARQIFPPPTVEISAERQNSSVSHLSLWRDVYYTPLLAEGRSLAQGSPERPVKLHRRGEIDPSGTVYDNEYFVLGDNSILSSDARAWTDPVDLLEGEDLYVQPGRVPERFLLGKAFFVYWPAGYRPFGINSPGIIPNFGDVRFIH